MKTPIRDQRGFLLLVGAVAAGRLALSWGHSPGSVQVGLTVLGLWAVGAVWAALIQVRQRPSRGGDLLGLLGVQNLAIQLLVVLPATLAGVVRLIRTSPESGGMAFVSNAVVTVLVVPLLGALVMTFMALAVAVPVRALLGSRAHQGAVCLLVALAVASYVTRYEPGPGTCDAARTFAHTTCIYLIDRQGRARYTFMHNDTPGVIAAGIEQVLEAAWEAN